MIDKMKNIKYFNANKITYLHSELNYYFTKIKKLVNYLIDKE